MTCANCKTEIKKIINSTSPNYGDIYLCVACRCINIWDYQDLREITIEEVRSLPSATVRKLITTKIVIAMTRENKRMRDKGIGGTS